MKTCKHTAFSVLFSFEPYLLFTEQLCLTAKVNQTIFIILTIFRKILVVGKGILKTGIKEHEKS
jgi:hypothetical protein